MKYQTKLVLGIVVALFILIVVYHVFKGRGFGFSKEGLSDADFNKISSETTGLPPIIKSIGNTNPTTFTIATANGFANQILAIMPPSAKVVGSLDYNTFVNTYSTLARNFAGQTTNGAMPIAFGAVLSQLNSLLPAATPAPTTTMKKV